MSIHLNNLTLSYDHHPAIHHINAIIHEGDWLAIIGPNGAGKSTLMNIIAGLTKDFEGEVAGLDQTHIAYLPQQTDLDKSFPMNVFELVSTGFWDNIGFFKSVNEKQYKECVDAIETVGLKGFEHRMIDTLSGGQLQRCLFARVLVQDKPIVLLDEPFNVIDTKTLSDLTEVLKQWHDSNRILIMVTHDLDYVQKYCPKTMLVARECIGYGLTQKILTENNLKKARRLSEAFDVNADWCPITAT